MMKAATYLDFKHNAREAIETYKAILGAEVVLQVLYDETMSWDKQLVGRIYHAELKIGDMNLYLSDSGKSPSFDSVSFVLEITDEKEARRVFEGLAQGGRVISDFKINPVGPTIAQVQDKVGVKWQVVIC
jgi:PhnB protein